MTTNDDAAAVRALGVPVPWSDGRTVHLRFDLDGLWHLEQTYGTVNAFAVALDAVSLSEPGSMDVLRTGLTVALAREGIGEAEVGALYPTVAWAVYQEALVDAFLQGVKADTEPGGSEPVGKAPAGTNGSAGVTSTTPAPSASAEATSSSGP